MPNADCALIDWYFDFLSPFAYLQHELLLNQPQVTLRYQPILFAGLLKHWGGKGPAEIPMKRVLTYQHCQYLAERLNIPLRFPPAHPFNPLPPLRLVIAQHNDPHCITSLFRALYAEGLDLHKPPVWQTFCQQLGVDHSATHLAQPWVKQQLHTNTAQAAQHGVFGVPTLKIGERLFWGLDMTDMALDYLRTPQRFQHGEYQRLADLPIAQARKSV